VAATGPHITATATTSASGTTRFSSPFSCPDYYNNGVCDGTDDSDGVVDALDNCLAIANANQRDTNADGFGNICDPDFHNDGIVDINDYNWLKSFLNKAPGPSGLRP
jgi:Thrombospondin type 3 repeat